MSNLYDRFLDNLWYSCVTFYNWYPCLVLCYEIIDLKKRMFPSKQMIRPESVYDTERVILLEDIFKLLWKNPDQNSVYGQHSINTGIDRMGQKREWMKNTINTIKKDNIKIWTRNLYLQTKKIYHTNIKNKYFNKMSNILVNNWRCAQFFVIKHRFCHLGLPMHLYWIQPSLLCA